MLVSLGEFGLAACWIDCPRNGEEPILIITLAFDLSPFCFEGFEVHIVINIVLPIRPIPALFGNDVGKLPSSFAAILVLSPTALQHVLLLLPLEEK